MARIAISYRREDSAAITGRIFDRLTAQYGSDFIFRDIDNIPLGVDFREHINTMLAETDITLVIIGKRWLGSARGRRRINDPGDPVRVEVETALRIGKPVIPVFVEGGGMPKADQLPDTLKDLIYRNGLDVDSGRDFDQHIDRLIRNIDPILAWISRQRAEEDRWRAEAARQAEEEKRQAEAAWQSNEEKRPAQPGRVLKAEQQQGGAVLTNNEAKLFGAPSSPAAATTAPSRPEIELDQRIIAELSARFSDKALVHIQPHIPPTKEANAKAAARIPFDEAVWILFDLTKYGSAKDCLVASQKRIYYRYWPNIWSIDYDSFENTIIQDWQFLWNHGVKIDGFVLNFTGGNLSVCRDFLRQLQDRLRG